MPHLNSADIEELSQELIKSLDNFILNIENSQLLIIRGDARPYGKECRLFASGAKETLDGFNPENTRLLDVIPNKSGMVIYYERSKAGLHNEIISQKHFYNVYPFQLIVSTTESKEEALKTLDQFEIICRSALKIKN